MPRRIGFVCFEGVNALDLTGPAEVFGTANAHSAGAYEILFLSSSLKPVTAEVGLRLAPDSTLGNAPPLDTIIVPGGAGLRKPHIAAPIINWLRERRRTRRIASVCTGIYALGASGLLNGRVATTHWRFATDVERRFPAISIRPDAIYLQDGSIFTSAGVTAGIDLALSFVESDLSDRIALRVARELVVYLKRPGGQMQFSEPLRFQTRSADRLAALATFIVTNLDKDLSVEALAGRAGLSVRQFRRRFTAVFSVPPGTYVEQIRLDESRKRLFAAERTVESVAISVGFASADSFRRAFVRRFGVAPSHFAKRFRVRKVASGRD
jgi:transcriptional regulator GlxA family with amidase domain